jgi:DNA-binding transcriptional LysR family regulator
MTPFLDKVDCILVMEYISFMQRFDFNLLQALDALLQEGSVRGAAERLNLTAPAMSHALSRLRGVMGDPLLVRAGQRLVPTPRALAIRDQVRQTVESGQSIFQDRPADELKGVTRTFTIRANDSVISVFGARLVKRVYEKAPHLQIRFAGRSDENINPLRDGSVDLDIGAVADVGPEICTERLLQDDFVCVMRAGHRLAKGRMTLKAYGDAEHVVASRRGHPRSSVDEVLTESGLVRRVPVVVPDALAAIAVASGSDLIATVPAAVAKWGERTMRVVVKQLPLAMPPMTMFQSWHPRVSADSAHRWLRECMAATVSGI